MGSAAFGSSVAPVGDADVGALAGKATGDGLAGNLLDQIDLRLEQQLQTASGDFSNGVRTFEMAAETTWKRVQAMCMEAEEVEQHI
jgi:hypothetical protein